MGGASPAAAGRKNQPTDPDPRSVKIYTRKASDRIDIRSMYPDEDAEDVARKETQAFDPSLVDEEGIHPKQATEDPAESVLLEQEQRPKETDEEPSRSGSWQTFKTP
jgi:hypothetical protein